MGIPTGAALFFHGYLLHRSAPNPHGSGQFRRVLAAHYMAAEGPLQWPPDTGVYDNRDVMLVAGHDPHAWKGMMDVHVPQLRLVGGEDKIFYDQRSAAEIAYDDRVRQGPVPTS